jgi:hypothetical protein
MQNQMSTTEQALANHPFLAIFSSLFSGILSFVGGCVPILQAILLIASLVLTIITIEAKLKERKINRDKYKTKKKYDVN